jgi:hypothetical protein
LHQNYSAYSNFFRREESWSKWSGPNQLHPSTYVENTRRVPKRYP